MGDESNPQRFEVGDRVRVAWPTSRLHGETGIVQRVRRGESDDDWQALTTSEQFPYCDPVWFGFRALVHAPKEEECSHAG